MRNGSGNIIKSHMSIKRVYDLLNESDRHFTKQEIYTQAKVTPSNVDQILALLLYTGLIKKGYFGLMTKYYRAKG